MDPEKRVLCIVSSIPQSVKNLTAMQETWVRFLGQEDPLVLEKTLESPLDCKEIQAVHSKGDQHSSQS